ncbi:hypothetical protein [Sporosarcina sp. FSL K6-1508]|uniref:hypothetical protein n=1 Tax=Sporosarcina sp. FSL K6-1508 TaxID=2921553 RepID=UPI0030F50E47
MLQSRKKLIELILRQDKEIRRIYIEATDQLARKIKDLDKIGAAYRIMEHLDEYLRFTSEAIESKLKSLFSSGLSISVEAGLHQSKQTTLSLLKRVKMDWQPMERSYFRVHHEAVQAMEFRTLKGLNLSDRIWGQSQKVRASMGTVIQEAIAAGEHPVRVAEMLQRYVRDGANSLVTEYPNMMDRIGDGLPKDLSYESLRLARTEMAAAYGEASVRSAELNPSNLGIQWSLSNAGVACSVCQDNAAHDSGLGRGVYKLEDLPDYPAHPNCLCNLSEVVENTDDFLERLVEWNANPHTHPDLESWYQTVYKTGKL